MVVAVGKPARYAGPEASANETIKIAKWGLVGTPDMLEIAMPTAQIAVQTFDDGLYSWVLKQTMYRPAPFRTSLQSQAGCPLSDRIAKALHRLGAHLLACLSRLGIEEIVVSQKLEAVRYRHYPRL